MSEAMNQHKQLAMGKKAAKSQQGASPGYKKGGKVAATKMAKGGTVGGKKSCNY